MARFNYIGQYLDNNGDPLSGGKLYFYDTGTTTPKTTYSDAAQTLTNTNPVILDADGRAGDIFYSGDAKLVIKTSADVTLETVDPVGSDQLSASDVKTLYESNTNTNAYTDAEKTKLAGIEALADVTDTANVTSSLDGASLTSITPAIADKVLLQDASDSNALKVATVGDVAALQDYSGYASLGDGEYIGITFDGTAAASGVSKSDVVGFSNSFIAPITASSVDNAGQVVGIAVENAASGASVKVLVYGFYCDTSWSWSGSANATGLYASQSGSTLTATRPASEPQLRVAARATSTVVFVNPRAGY
jgi:hypothetical protein